MSKIQQLCFKSISHQEGWPLFPQGTATIFNVLGSDLPEVIKHRRWRQRNKTMSLGHSTWAQLQNHYVPTISPRDWLNKRTTEYKQNSFWPNDKMNLFISSLLILVPGRDALAAADFLRRFVAKGSALEPRTLWPCGAQVQFCYTLGEITFSPKNNFGWKYARGRWENQNALRIVNILFTWNFQHYGIDRKSVV